MSISCCSNSYVLKLDERNTWNLRATKSTEAWLQRFAMTLALEHGHRREQPTITFVRGGGTGPPSTSLPWSPDSTALESLEMANWNRVRPGLSRFWSPPRGNDLVCELLNTASEKLEVLMMGEVVHPVYLKAAQSGGLPIHGALIALDGRGVVLAGANDAGKTTSCSRLPDRWKVLCDDETLVMKGEGNQYRAHPFPTWSNLLRSGLGASCDISRSVPLSAFFFLQKATSPEIVSLGRGHAAARINESADEVWTWRGQYLESKQLRAWRTQLFENACSMSANIPSYILRLDLYGRFWETIERILEDLPVPGT
ncbi:SynChlorMet cassette protein ScmC [Desulfomonile tiedjei]|uniref:SynChlorMet cassette protein ScmC n=1 Tax=Desulfomonile tiedjei (strain ATCC 49306 / DSM 6799 / DCB-1) TaxID=706587 RepID=I4CEA5_DESTA|nr:SynChlorMet cassette protein ScmC [Desulfomonile tiedjei]AFM27896.1 hypothetical protein Desti_5307 [Desulfomonile tiedjei DSM 6799]